MTARERVRMPELLAPAGGPQELNAALAAGADAVYCGYGHTFNARRGATSFDAQTFGPACDRAHLVGARVYVTVNVVIREDEMPSALALVRRAWLLGADAFIIQDWGLFREVKRLWPQVECHVSTQGNVHDARGVAWCAALGADRVTLSRELSLGEIARLAQEGVELESFCHGAICFCYSGVCQMSSATGARSANRGACAQPCRLPYELVDGQGNVLSAAGRGRPLCPKDFYSLDDLEALAATGVGSLKIEGRLKGADYVHAVVSAYREELDALATGPDAGRPAGTDDEDEARRARRRRLKRAFNRDFTNAYLHGTSGDELMSYERSNNRGELVGRVVDARSYGTVKVRRGGSGGGRERTRTSRIAEVDVLLDEPVGKGDLLELRPLRDPSQFVTSHAPQDTPAGVTLTCRTARTVEKGSLVRVIRSQRALDDGSRAAEAAVPRRREVHVRIRAVLGEPFLVELATADGAAHACATGPVVEPARTRAVSEEDLVGHVGRMGSSWFDPVAFDVELDPGCGMGFSMVHDVRARACEALEEAVLGPYRERELAPYRRQDRTGGATVRAIAAEGGTARSLADNAGAFGGPVGGFGHATEASGRAPDGEASCTLCAVVADAACARAALDAGADRVYASSDALATGPWPDGVVPVLDEVCREGDHARLDPWVRAGLPVAVGNVSELALARERGAAAEVRTCIPVHNAACLQVLAAAGARAVWLSPELSLEEAARLAATSPLPLGMVVLGRIRTMTSEHCVLQAADACVHDCARCKLRRRALYLRGDAGARYPVRTDAQGRSRIYAPAPLDLTAELPALLRAGIRRFAADCTLLTPAQTAQAVGRMLRPEPEPLPGSTQGHLYRAVL